MNPLKYMSRGIIFCLLGTPVCAFGLPNCKVIHSQRAAVIIPSRYASTRLPGKPLQDIQGKPMIQWVYETAKKSKLVSRVIVATDDQRIFDAVKLFGGEVMMTSPDHTNGTDRIAEVAATLNEDIIVNLQGDEPMMEPETIDAAIELVRSKNLKWQP